MRSLLVVVGLLFTAQGALAGADNQPAERASSVADMLQRKQEHQLREQFVKEGRWDEVRKLDEEQLRRQKLQSKQTLTRLNAELARESSSDTSISSDAAGLGFCAPVRGAIRGKSDVNAADTSYVR